MKNEIWEGYSSYEIDSEGSYGIIVLLKTPHKYTKLN